MKRTMLYICLAIGLNLLLGLNNASALTLTETGAELTIEYDEPTKNTDASLLTDLHHTNIYTDIRQDGIPTLKHPNVPATAQTGGGHIIQKVLIGVAAGKEIMVDVQVTATDITGNESAKGPVATIRLDRLAPEPPQ